MKRNNKYHIENLDKLIKLCKEKFSYNVIIEKNLINEVSFDNKTINLNSNQTDEFKVYTLLHEIGHIILTNRPSYSKKYNMKLIRELSEKQSTQLHKKSSKKLSYRVSVLHEELDAWYEGLNFCKKIKMTINEKKFRDLMSLCIRGYARYVVKQSYNP